MYKENLQPSRIFKKENKFFRVVSSLYLATMLTFLSGNDLNQNRNLLSVNAQDETTLTTDISLGPDEISDLEEVNILRPHEKAAKFICEIAPADARFEVVVAREQGTPSNVEAVRRQINKVLLDANGIFNKSAQRTGGEMVLSLDMGPDCWPVISEVEVSAAALLNAAALREELRAMGDRFKEDGRKYIVYATGNTGAYCGESDFVSSSMPGEGSVHNRKRNISIISQACMRGSITAHEEAHALGAVPLTAPHSSTGGHTYQANELMSEVDAPGNISLEVVCTEPGDGFLLDCGGDDYMNFNPPAGTYIASNWNIAKDSIFAKKKKGEVFLYSPEGYVETGRIEIYSGEEIEVTIPLTVSENITVTGLTIFANSTAIRTFTPEEIATQVPGEPLKFLWKVPSDIPDKETQYMSAVIKYTTDGQQLALRFNGEAILSHHRELLFLPVIQN